MPTDVATGASGEALLRLVVALVALSWVLAFFAELTGEGALFHHHALIEGTIAGAAPPLWLAVPAFLVAWQVMVAAMMVPPSLPAIRLFERSARTVRRPTTALVGFLAAFALMWTVFGLFTFLGDFVLHRVVATTPWLAVRPWLIQAAVFALAGLYQFTPFKRRSLAACRHPVRVFRPDGQVEGSGRVGLIAGLVHAIDCVGASWALMLLMFAAGFADLLWMAALTGLMVYESRGSRGHLAAPLAGVALLALAGAAFALAGVPGWGAT